MEKNKDKFKLSNIEHDIIYKEIEEQVFLGKHPKKYPIAIVLGGQPGSGKSFLIKEAKGEFDDGNVVIINGDEYRRWHPDSKKILNNYEEDYAFYTDADVRTWTSNLFDKAITDKYNFIFEGTMRTQKICETLKTIKQAGFSIKIKALAVNGIDSLISTLERYETQKLAEGHGRVTPAESHREAYYGMIGTLREIEKSGNFDTLEILTRKGDIIYFNDNLHKEIYSKYNLNIEETLIKSREEQTPSIEEIKRRIQAVSQSREKRGEEPINIQDIIEKIDKKCI